MCLQFKPSHVRIIARHITISNVLKYNLERINSYIWNKITGTLCKCSINYVQTKWFSLIKCPCFWWVIHWCWLNWDKPLCPSLFFILQTLCHSGGIFSGASEDIEKPFRIWDKLFSVDNCGSAVCAFEFLDVWLVFLFNRLCCYWIKRNIRETVLASAHTHSAAIISLSLLVLRVWTHHPLAAQ